MQIDVAKLEAPEVDQQRTESVERKGLGHPDTICDALTEQLSMALSRFYLERFGLILHHNVDKALLFAGASEPRFGGGRVLEPIQLFLAGRASLEAEGQKVPIEEIAVETSRRWIRDHFHALDPERHVRIHSLVRSGSADLVELYRRQRRTGVWLANDTSCGVGYAPLSDLERVVLRVEQRLNEAEVKRVHPEIGQDVKVMGVRRDDRIRLTVACAFVDRHVCDVEDYLAKRDGIAALVQEVAQPLTSRELQVEVNTADDPETSSLYLTVTGTSAEAGDDGEAGRGNRANGLITPCRPMTMESLAGKNPITHVGKLYNLEAALIADALVQELPEVVEARCHLVSQIGTPIGKPQIAEVQLRCVEDGSLAELATQAREIAGHHLEQIDSLWRDLLEGRVAIDRWPLRRDR
ncbi:MAG: methionine adenosyltransferase [Myxococcales bacterium]|nr:MAG: methionine adenosyltransferase [Myxococcales bacterium]